MEQASDAQKSTQPAWSDMAKMIEQSVSKAVKSSMAEAVSSLRSDLASLGARISTMDEKLSLLTEDVNLKLAAQSSRLTSAEQQISQIAKQCASESLQLDLQTETVADLKLKMSALKSNNVMTSQAINDFDQQSRCLNLRFTGIGVQDCTAKLEVLSIIRDKLNINNVTDSSISNVTMISSKKPLSTLHSSSDSSLGSSSSKPILIVTFANKEIRNRVLTNRRHLKGTHIGISEDLTPQNLKFINTHRKDQRLKNIWSWNGKLYVLLQGEEKKRIINPLLTLEEQLLPV